MKSIKEQFKPLWIVIKEINKTDERIKELDRLLTPPRKPWICKTWSKKTVARKFKCYYSSLKNLNNNRQIYLNEKELLEEYLVELHELEKEKMEFLPERFRNYDSIYKIIAIANDGRAYNLKDCINLMIEDERFELILKKLYPPDPVPSLVEIRNRRFEDD